jgi:DNA-binding MarR family transcriptional regulator
MAREFDLETYLPYLVNRLAVRFVATFTAELKTVGLTLPMWRVLAALHHHGAMRLGSLAERTTIELSTLSRTVAAMERRRLLTRRREEPDARALRVAPTAAGAALTRRLIPAALRCEAAALRQLSPPQAETLRMLLRRAHDGFADAERGA